MSSHVVHVVDRWPLFAEVLAASLTRAGLTASASNVDSCPCDAGIVLLDADRPVEVVAADVAAVRRIAPHAEVVAVIRDGTPRRGLVGRVDADAWLSRSSTAQELVTHLRHGGVSTLHRLMRPAPTHGVMALTEREIEILDVMSSGGSTRDAADELTISQHTVRTHLQNIHAKLGVSTRLAAVTAARNAGLLPGLRAASA